MSLFDLIGQDGIALKKMAGTNGGEYAGPCPFCGGDDRFRVWPEKNRYWCRQCKKSGDSIQFLRDTKSLSYQEACLYLNIEPKVISQSSKPEINSWTPREVKTMPEQVWQMRAENFLSVRKSLPKDILQWLKNRGLSMQTIKDASLAWNPIDVWLSRESFGLSPLKNEETGNLRTVWLPRGLIIPFFFDRHIIRIRFRRPDDVKDSYGRYTTISGSADRPMFWKSNTKAYAIVESELDGLLIHQEAGNLVNIIALGSAQARPDKETYHALSEAEIILLCLDYDEAGTKESWGWWPGYFKQVVRWPCPIGKDPGEAFQKGLDILAWIQAGLPKLKHQEVIR